MAILLASTAALSLWLRAAYLPLGIWAAADDAVYVRMAGQIAAGGWLGPYDFLVLAKGAFFPVFVAFNKALGLPLKITEHILFLLAALFAATTSARLTGHRWLLPTAFLVLALSPMPWMLEGGARVTREPLYQTLTVALFFLAALHFRNAGKKRWLGLVLGIGGGCYWLTREEGVWLLPTIAVLALPWLAEIRQSVRSQGMTGSTGRGVRAARTCVRVPVGGDYG